MEEEKKKETEKSEVKVEGTEQPKKSVVEKVKEEVKDMPGGSPNTYQVNAETGTSDQKQHNVTTGTSSSVQRKVYDDDAMRAAAAGAEDTYRRTPTAVDMVMPWLKDDLDPEKIAAAKKDANFRKGLHEAVESLRVLSDIGASFAGGNAYKREAPDYKRYEDEKAKIDAARKAALDKLFQAQAADRDYKRQLMGVAYGNAFTNEQNGKTNQTSDGRTHTQTEKEGATIGHQRGGNTYINNGGGYGNLKDVVSVQRPYAVKQERADAEGDYTMQGNNYGYATVQFADKKRKNEFMRGMSQVLLGDGDERTSKSGKDFRKFYDYFAANSGVDDVEFYDNNGNMTADGVKVVRHILSRNNAGGEMENVGYTYNNKDYTNVVESGLLYCTDNANATKLRNEYVKNRWITEWQDEGTGGKKAMP